MKTAVNLLYLAAVIYFSNFILACSSGSFPEDEVVEVLKKNGMPGDCKILSAIKVNREKVPNYNAWDEVWCVTTESSKGRIHFLAIKDDFTWNAIGGITESGTVSSLPVEKDFTGFGCNNW